MAQAQTHWFFRSYVLCFSAVYGCDYVLHVASPFPIVADESVVKTAVDGTLNVLRACAACESVKKVVLTSSCSAVNGESHRCSGRSLSHSSLAQAL